jgi:hypothetical protein
MFQSIVHSDAKTLLLLGQKFHYVYKNFSAALLCLDHGFATPPKVQGIPHAQVASSLHLYLAYIRLFEDVLHYRTPENNPAFRKVFGFRDTEDHLFYIPKNTFLYLHANETRTLSVRSDEEGFSFRDYDFRRVLCTALRQRVRERVSAQDRVCRETRGFALCLHFVSSGKCTRADCYFLHMGSKDLNIQWYNTRIRIFLLQFQIIRLANFDNHFFYYR